MSFIEELRAETKDLREQVFANRFVRGIGDGTLEPGKFRFYLAQDYRFLIMYARVIAIASARSPTLSTQARFASLLDATLNTEMELHRQLCARQGLSADDLERTEPAPACAAYTRHLLGVAWSGTLGEICASLVPCQHGYEEIAEALAEESPEGNPYNDWIATYTSPEYRDLAAWINSLTEDLAAAAGEQERERMRLAYTESARHEGAFWEMAWQAR